jgi:hypothetical protein
MVFADDPNNYRPISVLPTISKLFEKVVCSQFYDFLSRLFKNVVLRQTFYNQY